jgi:hypothetical protein
MLNKKNLVENLNGIVSAISVIFFSIETIKKEKKKFMM